MFCLQIPCGATLVLTGVQQQAVVGCILNPGLATLPNPMLQAQPNLCCAPIAPPPPSKQPPPSAPSSSYTAHDYCEWCVYDCLHARQRLTVKIDSHTAEQSTYQQFVRVRLGDNKLRQRSHLKGPALYGHAMQTYQQRECTGEFM